MILKTEELKNAVNKSVKGAGFNNLFPVTSMMGINKEKNQLQLVTTDMTNTLTVKVCTVSDDINITVDADKFSKLVSKLTSDETELIVEDTNLVIKANGTYKLPINVDENGIVELNSPKAPNVDVAGGAMSLETIKQLRNSNKSSLEEFSEKLDDQYYLSSYYCGTDNTTTTNRFIATFSKKSITQTPILLPIKMVDLICLSDNDKVYKRIDKDVIQLFTDDISIISKDIEDVSEYPINSIKTLLSEDFEYSCTVDKSELLSSIDRLCLFIDPYDDNELVFKFDTDNINITNKASNSSESIKCEPDNSSSEPFRCVANAYEFISLLSSITTKEIVISYGNENALKIESEETTHILSLTDEDEE